jgi:hypothetical protein
MSFFGHLNYSLPLKGSYQKPFKNETQKIGGHREPGVDDPESQCTEVPERGSGSPGYFRGRVDGSSRKGPARLLLF